MIDCTIYYQEAIMGMLVSMYIYLWVLAIVSGQIQLKLWGDSLCVNCSLNTGSTFA